MYNALSDERNYAQLVQFPFVYPRFPAFPHTQKPLYRPFSLDVMLSSNIAASIVLNGYQYSFMHASFYTIVCNGLSMNFSIHGSSAWQPY